jgi:hypothetical protein
MSENIAGKVVVITGASSGLGESELMVAGNARPVRSRRGRSHVFGLDPTIRAGRASALMSSPLPLGLSPLEATVHH